MSRVLVHSFNSFLAFLLPIHKVLVDIVWVFLHTKYLITVFYDVLCTLVKRSMPEVVLVPICPGRERNRELLSVPNALNLSGEINRPPKTNTEAVNLKDKIECDCATEIRLGMRAAITPITFKLMPKTIGSANVLKYFMVTVQHLASPDQGLNKSPIIKYHNEVN